MLETSIERKVKKHNNNKNNEKKGEKHSEIRRKEFQYLLIYFEGGEGEQHGRLCE